MATTSPWAALKAGAAATVKSFVPASAAPLSDNKTSSGAEDVSTQTATSTDQGTTERGPDNARRAGMGNALGLELLGLRNGLADAVESAADMDHHLVSSSPISSVSSAPARPSPSLHSDSHFSSSDCEGSQPSSRVDRLPAGMVGLVSGIADDDGWMRLALSLSSPPLSATIPGSSAEWPSMPAERHGGAHDRDGVAQVPTLASALPGHSGTARRHRHHHHHYHHHRQRQPGSAGSAPSNSGSASGSTIDERSPVTPFSPPVNFSAPSSSRSVPVPLPFHFYADGDDDEPRFDPARPPLGSFSATGTPKKQRSSPPSTMATTTSLLDSLSLSTFDLRHGERNGNDFSLDLAQAVRFGATPSRAGRKAFNSAGGGVFVPRPLFDVDSAPPAGAPAPALRSPVSPLRSRGYASSPGSNVSDLVQRVNDLALTTEHSTPVDGNAAAPAVPDVLPEMLWMSQSRVRAGRSRTDTASTAATAREIVIFAHGPSSAHLDGSALHRLLSPYGELERLTEEAIDARYAAADGATKVFRARFSDDKAAGAALELEQKVVYGCVLQVRLQSGGSTCSTSASSYRHHHLNAKSLSDKLDGSSSHASPVHDQQGAFDAEGHLRRGSTGSYPFGVYDPTTGVRAPLSIDFDGYERFPAPFSPTGTVWSAGGSVYDHLSSPPSRPPPRYRAATSGGERNGNDLWSVSSPSSELGMHLNASAPQDDARWMAMSKSSEGYDEGDGSSSFGGRDRGGDASGFWRAPIESLSYVPTHAPYVPYSAAPPLLPFSPASSSPRSLTGFGAAAGAGAIYSASFGRQNVVAGVDLVALNNAGVPKHNQISLERVERGADTRTTVMIRNIPNRMDDKMLMAFIDAVVPRSYDFVYLRRDFATGCGVGYAFLNLVSPDALLVFLKAKLGQRWNCFRSDKVMLASYANIQGKEALIEHFRNSVIMDKDESCRPKLFHSSGPLVGLPEPFPAPNNMPRKMRSVASAKDKGLFLPTSGRTVSRQARLDHRLRSQRSGSNAATVRPSSPHHLRPSASSHSLAPASDQGGGRPRAASAASIMSDDPFSPYGAGGVHGGNTGAPAAAGLAPSPVGAGWGGLSGPLAPMFVG